MSGNPIVEELHAERDALKAQNAALRAALEELIESERRFSGGLTSRWTKAVTLLAALSAPQEPAR